MTDNQCENIIDFYKKNNFDQHNFRIGAQGRTKFVTWKSIVDKIERISTEGIINSIKYGLYGLNEEVLSESFKILKER